VSEDFVARLQHGIKSPFESVAYKFLPFGVSVAYTRGEIRKDHEWQPFQIENGQRQVSQGGFNGSDRNKPMCPSIMHVSGFVGQ
jgi:hypothetical protein